MFDNHTSTRLPSSDEAVEYLDERIEILALFSHGTDRLKCMPRKMKFRNRIITFSELGFRHPTSKGTRTIHVFDMSDDSAEYRIEFDTQSLTWTLLSRTPIS